MTKKEVTIQAKFLRAILMIILVPLLVTPLIGYVYSSNLITDKLQILTQQNLENIKNSMEDVIDDLIIASNVLALDLELQDDLRRPPSGDTHIETTQKSLLRRKLYYVEASTLFPYNVQTILIGFNGKHYITGEGYGYDYHSMVKSDWFLDAVAADGFFLWKGSDYKILNYDDGLTLIRMLKDNYIDPIGVLAIHLFEDKKVRTLLKREEDFNGTERFLLTDEGSIILSSLDESQNSKYASALNSLDSNTPTMTTINGEKVIVAQQTLNKTNWRLVQIIPHAAVLSEVTTYRNTLILINVGFIILVLLAVYVTTRQITKAIKTLNKTVNEVTKGDLSVRSEVSGSLEVNQLSQSFNYMIQRIQELLQEVEHETEQKHKHRYDALQSQINPHFLLNTLNSIKWLCIIENAPTAEKMMISLGFLLEKTLGRYHDYITFEEEIKCVEHYIKLQQMRYGKKFELTVKVDFQARKVKVPVLFLQPIVENSIIHAFDDMEGKGKIQIKAITREDYLEIWIIDNGKGMDEATISRLLGNEEDQHNNPHFSIGIKNVKERIELLYGDPCGLGIESEIGKGTKTVLLIRDIEKGVGINESIDCR